MNDLPRDIEGADADPKSDAMIVLVSILRAVQTCSVWASAAKGCDEIVRGLPGWGCRSDSVHTAVPAPLMALFTSDAPRHPPLGFVPSMEDSPRGSTPLTGSSPVHVYGSPAIATSGSTLRNCLVLGS